jgi:nucleotide-binding universal stress UspA family protein
MYRKIMVPTDGSGFDRDAILVGLRVAERNDAKVRLVRVLTTGALFGMTGSPDGVGASVEALCAEHDAALTELYALAAECRCVSSAEISVDLEQGPVADVLEAYAKRNEIDLIVISSHGRHGIARLSLGSVTDSLIRGTTIPVLVVKPKASYLSPDASKEFHHIVVPLDGSPLAEQIITRVVALAKLEEAELTLLHVLMPSEVRYTDYERRSVPWWERQVAEAQAYLARKANQVRRHGIDARTDVVVGENVSEAITDYARREGADLIAIATHGRGGLARALRGSVADAVTRSAMSSILVFHPEMAVEKKISTEAGEKAREAETAFV